MPQRPRSHQLETESRRAFASALPVAWVTRDGNPDYGIDVPVEIFDDAKATGRTFNTQLKATDQPDLAKALTSVRFDLETIEYYKSLSVPTLIVLYHAPTRRLYQQWLHAYDSVARGGRAPDPDAKSMMIRFLEIDAWSEATPTCLNVGVRGYDFFHSPALPLPLRVGVRCALVSAATARCSTRSR
jgi:hypothetical protein